MKYALTFGGDSISLGLLTPEEHERAQRKVNEWWSQFRSAGKIFGGAQLRAPWTATTVRFDQDPPSIVDGPCTPESEAIGGYGLIEVDDLDEALAMVKTWPAGGYVEIRPLVDPRLDPIDLGLAN